MELMSVRLGIEGRRIGQSIVALQIGDTICGMSGEKIRQRLRQKPFVPFRLRLSDGSFIDVKDAGGIEVVPRQVRVNDGGRMICPREIAALDEIR
jgi:hypothetical protein